MQVRSYGRVDAGDDKISLQVQSSLLFIQIMCLTTKANHAIVNGTVEWLGYHQADTRITIHNGEVDPLRAHNEAQHAQL